MINLLVVDDEKEERDGLAYLSSSLFNYITVYYADNGISALEVLEKQRIEIMITDIKMPKMGGIKLLENTVPRYPDLKIIIYSGYADFEYARKGIRFHVQNYLLKPISIDAFKDAMTTLINEIKKVDKFVPDSPLKTNQNIAGTKVQSYITLKVIDIIYSEYNTDLNLTYISEKLDRTPTYISHIFAQETGKSFLKYLTDFRMVKAKELITNSSRKINSISMECGFQNPAYFNQVFKSYYGMTPVQFRLKKTSE
jgi:two-component system response regulator YesN